MISGLMIALVLTEQVLRKNESEVNQYNVILKHLYDECWIEPMCFLDMKRIKHIGSTYF